MQPAEQLGFVERLQSNFLNLDLNLDLEELKQPAVSNSVMNSALFAFKSFTNMRDSQEGSRYICVRVTVRLSGPT